MFYPGAFSYNIIQSVFCKVTKNQIKTQDDYFQFGQYSFNGNIYTDGRVGIGITTPVTNLHVVGNGYVTNTLSVCVNPTGIGNNTLFVGGNTNLLRNLIYQFIRYSWKI